MPDFQHFQLRGMCIEKETDIDRQFILGLQNMMSGRPVWNGFSSSKINFNENLHRWELSSRIPNRVLASLPSDAGFPLGEQYWKLESENICHDKPAGYQLRLMFSNCGQFEYSCSDGNQ